MLRHAAVAGSWYPGDPRVLARDLDRYLDLARPPAGVPDQLVALIVPHAGLMYSGPVAAFAYAALEGRRFDVAVLVGPSHYLAFDGVAVWPDGSFETPLGPLAIDERGARRLLETSPRVRAFPSAHLREHSLEMQLPFLKRTAPDVPLVPLVMGDQSCAAAAELGDALAAAFAGRRALFVASTDLSHFFDADTANRLDAHTADLVERFDVEGLAASYERHPEHERGRFVMCGGGAALAVMRAARQTGADAAHVLRRAHSGDVSGDGDRVVGYLAAALGRFNQLGH